MTPKSNLEFHSEEWVYTGRRLVNGKLAVSYQDLAGREILYAMKRGVTHRALGSTYTVEVNRQDDHINAKIGLAKFSTPGKPLPEWIVQDKAAYTTYEREKRERSAKSNSDSMGHLTLKQLQVAMTKLPWSQRAAFVAQVISYLHQV